MRTGRRWRWVLLVALGFVIAIVMVAPSMRSDQAITAQSERLNQRIQNQSLPESNPYSEVDGPAIDRAVEEGMELYGIPGLAIGVVKDGQTVYLKGYGKADDNGRPVMPDTPFILGSVSKSFTSLAVMQLAEKGMLDLDTAAESYLPGVILAVPQGARAINVRDLLQHTSGLSTYDGRSMLTIKGRNLEEALIRIGGLTAVKRPGESFQYSNANYILLGAIVEQVSGLSYSEYMKEHVFKPLEMTNSSADSALTQINGLADGYQRIFGKLTATHRSVRASNVPAGYLAASAEDMTHFLIAQMEGGRYGDASLLSKQGMEEMHRGTPRLPYGMGWFITPSVIAHGGDAENFHADVILLPEKGWAISVLMNTNDAFMTSLYGNVFESISYHLLQIASSGEAFPLELPNMEPFGSAVYWMNALAVLLAVWALWALWRLWNGLSQGGWQAVSSVWVSIAHIALSLIFLFGYPHLEQTPWTIIMSFMPGWGHVLFIVPLALLIAGIVEIVLFFWNRWRWP